MGAVFTALKASYFDDAISCAVIPAPRNSAPAPAATQPPVICHGRSPLGGGGMGDSPAFVTDTVAVAGSAAASAGAGVVGLDHALRLVAALLRRERRLVEEAFEVGQRLDLVTEGVVRLPRLNRMRELWTSRYASSNFSGALRLSPFA